jgi:putative endonuclease
MSSRIGAAAEARAARHLTEIGYRILARNAGSKVGEIDLVADEAGVICFVEVRLRRAGATAAESVDRRKQQRIARAAERWLSGHGKTSATCRFDVVVLDGSGQVALIRDAFYLQAGY